MIIPSAILLAYFIPQPPFKHLPLHKHTLIHIIFYTPILPFILPTIYFLTFQCPYYINHFTQIPKISHRPIAIHAGLIGPLITRIILCKIKN
ncbi:prolipoprotein diacylglyceryl transferase family protein, partial [Staphylococcus epidermidis]|uniref:prolipoprotein diacylglyceryl transferase family protein n=1 Tax=Staphylococcus epidermidis TaxID=1282 RepID=UPI0037DA5D90